MNSRPSRRALTLVEVLAATVLLVTLSSVCIALLRDVGPAHSELRSDAGDVDRFALARFADNALSSSEHESLWRGDVAVEVTLGWPEHPDWPPVRIRSVMSTSGTESPTHRWIAFSCADVVVWRYARLRKEQ